MKRLSTVLCNMFLLLALSSSTPSQAKTLSDCTKNWQPNENGMADLYRYLGEKYVKAGDWECVALTYNAALELEPSKFNVRRHGDLAYALGRTGDYIGAAREYREVLRLKPKGSTARWAQQNLAAISQYAAAQGQQAVGIQRPESLLGMSYEQIHSLYPEAETSQVDPTDPPLHRRCWLNNPPGLFLGSRVSDISFNFENERLSTVTLDFDTNPLFGDLTPIPLSNMEHVYGSPKATADEQVFGNESQHITYWAFPQFKIEYHGGSYHSVGYDISFTMQTAKAVVAEKTEPEESKPPSLTVAAQPVPPRMTISAIAKDAHGAVASIIMSGKDGSPIAQGTGFLISKDGLILTNYHVIESGSSAMVKLPDGAFFVVDGLLAFDKARDVAIIKAHGENFRTLELGNSDQLQVGEEVVAIGSPLSLESTVSNGIISGIRTVDEEGGKLLQVTTPISPGSSGGPLFNMAGEVVGITTLYLKGGQNLNFAIPINDAKRLLLSNSSKVQALSNEKIPTADVPRQRKARQ